MFGDRVKLGLLRPLSHTVWVNGSLDTVHSKRKPLVKATAKMRLPTKTPKAGPYLFSEPDQHSSAIPLPSPDTSAMTSDTIFSAVVCTSMEPPPPH